MVRYELELGDVTVTIESPDKRTADLVFGEVYAALVPAPDVLDIDELNDRLGIVNLLD